MIMNKGIKKFPGSRWWLIKDGKQMVVVLAVFYQVYKIIKGYESIMN